MQKIIEERQKIQNRIKKLDDEEKNDSPQNNSNLELRQAQLSYCKDPFKYMDYLLEQHFKNNIIKDDDKIKKKIKEDYAKFEKGLIEDFTIFKNRQKVFLERIQDKYYVINRKKNNLNILEENAELVSEPLYQGEDIRNIFNQMPQDRFNLVINSAGDAKNELINDINSKLYKNKLCQGVIQCMSGGGCHANFVSPKHNFLEINNVKMGRDEYIEGKRDFNTKRYKEKLEKNCEEKICENEEKTVNLENKIFDMKYNNYINKINEYENKKEDNFKILNDIKDQMTKDKLFNILTHKQLNIFKKSKDEIKNILTQKNGGSEFLGFNLDNDNNDNEKENELKEEYFKQLKEADLKFNNDVKKINDEIDKLNSKYGFKPKMERNNSNNNSISDSKNRNKNYVKNNNKKRNKSSYNITNRKFFNDNPYHYNYNYNGASIPIKKKLNKFP
jgi:hypothetical protein